MTDIAEYGDSEPLPDVAPKSARAWLALITAAERAFADWQQRADNIDKLYASLRHLANPGRDREFALFWANIQVLGPSVYARPPVPVVVPKFKDRRPLYRVASELLERCCVVSFDMTDINSVMLLLRDDLTIVGRGQPWVRYETKSESAGASERLVIEHLDRKDFLHEPARNWMEVGWVARRGWMTRKEMRKRFRATSGDAYQQAAFEVRREDRDNGAADQTLKAGVWEIWSKTENRVVWVAEGVDVLLDDDEPHLKLEGFFPCPKPAYATVQRRSLIPVPDMVYYKDQLEEINELTGRIHALASAVQVRGFYPAGAGEIGEAIEAALKSVDNRQVMVPVSNWAAFGGGAAKDTIVWLPIDMIVATITQLVELRRQVIDDVYQIMGLSDIMRGSTDANETLGAQQIKAQFGSVRIRDKQAELVRIARDLVRICAEIMAEEFDTRTLLDMSQMQIPTDAEIKARIEALTQQAEQQMAGLEQQAMQALQSPEAMQQAQQNPDQAHQMLEQAQQQIIAQVQPQIEKLTQQPTVEQVTAFLKDQRIRPFVLDIETDSTIQPDEQAEKAARTEFVTALATLITQFTPLLQTAPEMATMVGAVIKFALAPFRVGRELEGAIDEAIEQVIARARQPQANPEAEALQAEQQMKAAELQARMQELQAKADAERQKADADMQIKAAEFEGKQREAEAKLAQIAAATEREAQKGAIEMQKLQVEIEARREELAIKRASAQLDAAVQVQSAAIDADSAARNAEQSERSFEQQSQLAAQKATQRGGV